MTDTAALSGGTIDLWELPWFETLLALGTFITLLSYSQNSPYQMNFVANVVLFGLFFYSNFIPFFDGNMKLFMVMASMLIAVGALVGGVLCMLLPKLLNRTSLAFYTALLICVLLRKANGQGGSMEDALFIFIFGTVFGALTWFADRIETLGIQLRDSLVIGFAFSMIVDSVLRQGLFLKVVAILCANEHLLTWSCSKNCLAWVSEITWIIATGVFFVHTLIKKGSMPSLFRSMTSRNGYLPVPTINPNSAAEPQPTSYKQRTFSYPDALVFNYFDPDDIPAQLKPYAEGVFTLAQMIMKIHGFQIDSSRNQAEHLIMLLFNETRSNDTALVSPAVRIHKRTFTNYRKWCDKMNVRPLLFADLHPSNLQEALQEDILVFLLIWGEAANLRHTPECLCFLFHKTMEEHIALKELWHGSNSNQDERKYPGFFLDMVISPLYDVVAKSITKKGDHIDRKIYDDFNEFFWSSNCLQYRLYGGEKDNLEAGEITGSALAIAMDRAAKTYLEKRSWFHPLYSMSRIFEWHTITFTLLATWAFSNLLQWTYAFTLQVGSIIFIEITLFGIIWTCLEVWTLFPTAMMTDPSLCGYLIRILAGYLVLSYQVIYYHWSFVAASEGGLQTSLKAIALFNKGDDIFWWWQYIWLSLMACGLYFIQSILTFFPSVITNVLESRNEFVQALLSICYPLSQLYVGKKTSLTSAQMWQTIAYWLSLLLFKLWFGYRYVIAPVATPTVDLYDDYMNFRKGSFLKTSTLMFFWWFPHFLVYIIDLSIWYAVWSSIVGGFVAIMDRLGAIRDSFTFRSHFMRAPKLFFNSFMPTLTADDHTTSSKRSLTQHLSTWSLSDLVADKRVTRPSSQASKSTSMKSPIMGIPTSKSREFAHLPPLPQHDDFESGGGYQSLSEVEMRGLKSTAQQPSASMRAFKDQEWTIFARVWNEIVYKLRERDFINNREQDWLLFSHFPFLTKPTYLPIYQTAGCIEHAAASFKEACEEYAQETEKQSRMKIIEKFKLTVGTNAFEAVLEAWELFGWTMVAILGPIHLRDFMNIYDIITTWTEDTALFERVSGASMAGLMNHAANIAIAIRSAIPKRKNAPVVPADYISSQAAFAESELASMTGTGSGSNMKKSISTGFLQSLEGGNDNSNGKRYTKLKPFRKGMELVDQVRDKIRDELKSMINIFRLSLKDNRTDAAEMITKQLTYIINVQTGFFGNDAYASGNIDTFCRAAESLTAVKKLENLLRLRVTEVELRSHEANRRLNFLMNSLYMDVPKLPQSRYCREYTTITPYYSEDIMLTKGDLLSVNSDNVSVLLYLQTLYKDDWENFLERHGIDESAIWSSRHLQHVRIWASCRAQTLYRTVEGMMYTEAAIRLLAELEQVATPEVDLLCKLKFNYVVACQIYGTFKRNQDSKADDIDFLLAKYPNLRVAYIDTYRLSSSELGFYSVLVKCEPKEDTNEMKEDDDIVRTSNSKPMIKEVFRVKLPGNPVLGEGKPENQNHAIIFTRGRYLQAIDMNQDGYFEEALKMRNVLEEFRTNTAIVGFREHIFTGSVSSVANYMALQELSFVTLGQRVLNRPLKIRQHYGHPDIFDKLFVMTEGGMSKASRGINLSEDVFAGFNATIRGYEIDFIEYVQVGKGRDVGLQQTYKFEAKLSQGNAEQSISRDMSRLGNRLDFFRLLSFYYGGIGHYLSNALVMFTLVIVVYTMLALAVYDEEGINGRAIHPEGVFQLILAGMGILQTLPLAVTLTVEKGFRTMLSEISFMIISGGPLYFIFHIQTKCYYFSQTLLAGGAMYRPTGRGFVTRHSLFEENFRFFAASHIYVGFELVVALVLFALYTKSEQYGGLTWSLWMAAIALVLGPFWFNPLSFEWSRLTDDYSSWLRWMMEIGGSAESSWETWWREENNFYANLSSTWKLFLVIQKCTVWVLISFGIAGSKFFDHSDEQFKFLEVVGTVGGFFLGQMFLSRFEREWSYPVRRLASLLLTSATLCTMVYLFALHTRHFVNMIALYYFAAAVSFLFLIMGKASWIQRVYKVHDYVVGHFIFFLLGFASIFQVGTLQTWLLYHNALSRGVEIEDILKYARKSKEKAGSETETIADLRSKIAIQEKKIQELIESRHHGSTVIEPSERSMLRHGSAPPRGNASSGYGAMSSPGLSALSSAAVSDSLSAAAAAEAVRPSPGPTVPMANKSSDNLLNRAAQLPPCISDAPAPPIRPSASWVQDTESSASTGIASSGSKQQLSSPTGEFVFQQPSKFPSRK